MSSWNPVKTFPVKKRINTELFINGKEGLFTKVKEGLDQTELIKKISDLLEEGRILAGNKWAGVKTAAACLGELAITWKGS